MSEEQQRVDAVGLWPEYFRLAPYGLVLFKATRHDTGRLSDFEWVELNPAAAEVLGLRREDVLERTVRSVYPDHLDPRIYRRLVTAHVTGRVQEFEQTMPRAAPRAGARESDGDAVTGGTEPSWFAVTVIPLPDDHVVVQFRSITHYKNVLRQAVEDRKSVV